EWPPRSSGRRGITGRPRAHALEEGLDVGRPSTRVLRGIEPLETLARDARRRVATDANDELAHGVVPLDPLGLGEDVSGDEEVGEGSRLAEERGQLPCSSRNLVQGSSLDRFGRRKLSPKPIERSAGPPIPELDSRGEHLARETSRRPE